MTRRALGSYEVDAPVEIKVSAIRQCVLECFAELAELGMDASDAEDLSEECFDTFLEVRNGWPGDRDRS